MMSKGILDQNFTIKQGCIMSSWLCSDGDENGDGEDRSEILGGGERVEIACPLVCR